MPINFPKCGDGILLRDFRPGDAEALADIEYNADVKRFLRPMTYAREEWLRRYATMKMPAWAIETLPDRLLAGRVSIDPTGIENEGELQIVIGKKFWGRGIGRKAAALAIPAAFEEMGATSLTALVHPDNSASIALVQSFGFTYCDKRPSDPSDWQSGHLIYTLTRTAFESAQRVRDQR